VRASAVRENTQEHSAATPRRDRSDLLACEATTISRREDDLVAATTCAACTTVERDVAKRALMYRVPRCSLAHDVECVCWNWRRDETAEWPTSSDAVRRLSKVEDRPTPEVGLAPFVESRKDETRSLR